MNKWERTASLLEENLVVEAELELGHAGQVALHLDDAHHLRAKHRAGRSHQHVHRLDHVQERLVLTVLDAFEPPRDRVRHRLHAHQTQTEHLTMPAQAHDSHKEIASLGEQCARLD